MPKFMQLIEYTTSKFDEITKITDEWLAATGGKRTATRTVITKDRERPDTYLDIVEFPSYEEAMRNSDMPETREAAERWQKLCDGPMTFRNLDVVRDET
jgi:hypothetical protein